MIITEEMVIASGVCADTIKFNNVSPAFNALSGRDHKEIIQGLKDMGLKDFAVWLIAVRARLILTSPGHRLGRFRVSGLTSPDFRYFNSLGEAEAFCESEKQKYIEQEAGRFSVTKEITLENGDVTWAPVVDINAETQDDDFKIFNHKTGLHEHYTTISAVKDRLAELKKEFVSNIIMFIEQEVISADGSWSGWFDFKNPFRFIPTNEMTKVEILP